MTIDASPRPFSPRKLAERWGCKRRKVLSMITRGDLKAFRVGNQFRISDAEVRRLDGVLAGRSIECADGYIYFIRAIESGKVKIGFSTQRQKRFSAIMTECPEPVELLVTMRGTIEDEHALHIRFALHRHIGEWFRPAPELLAYIDEVRRAPTS